ncbi:MAG TPA: ABC transporter permease [Streptosporangiaceae bacterium]
MTTTSTPPPAGAGPGAAPVPSAGAAPDRTVAIITGAPEPHPTTGRTFAAMLAREFRVLGRNAPSTFVRSVVQPLLWVFVFTYVMPKIGAAGVFEAGAARGGGATTFSTILLPGLMASMLLMQGILGTTFPLVMEFSWQRTIEDRALAPVPLSVLAFEKIVAGAFQAFVGALIVIPIVLYVHASGQSPHAHVTNWFLLALILVAASMLTAALGLLLGTLMDPRKMQMLFAVILLPATMLGCVYYPWSALHSIRWLQIAVLFNPMVYMSEGLRAVLTPGVGHLAMWAILLVLIGGAAVIGYLGTRTFRRRVLN